MSNTSLRHRSLAIAAAAASVVAVSLTMSNAARASDGKTWPATICQRWTGTGNPTASYLSVSPYGGLVNLANKRYGVVCPLMRDSMSSKIEEVRVFALGKNCSGVTYGNPCMGLTTRCRMRVMNLYADNQRFGSTHTLVRSDSVSMDKGRTTARWTNITMPNFPTGAALHLGSSFVMFCEIGVGEHLGGFYLREGT